VSEHPLRSRERAIGVVVDYGLFNVEHGSILDPYGFQFVGFKPQLLILLTLLEYEVTRVRIRLEIYLILSIRLELNFERLRLILVLEDELVSGGWDVHVAFVHFI
jgi:hypothetical protein